MVSRLKGIETVISQYPVIHYAKTLDMPSRLKGIETWGTNPGMVTDVTLDMPSRLKGIETYSRSISLNSRSRLWICLPV